MLERQPYAGRGTLVSWNVRRQTRDLVNRLARHLNVQAWRLAEMLVEAEIEAQGLYRDGRRRRREKR